MAARRTVRTPGRYRVQDALDRGIDDRILFAGDWMGEFVHMECAAQSAADAAGRLAARLRGHGGAVQHSIRE